jgi:hypothetical protein
MTKSKIKKFLHTLCAEPIIMVATAAPVCVATGQDPANESKMANVSTGRLFSMTKHIASDDFDDLVVNPYHHAIASRLNLIRDLDAVFTCIDENNTVHVFSVAAELTDAVYNKLFRKEPLIQQDHPKTRFEFHLRAHQGRQITSVVPLGAEPIFRRV